MQNTNNRIHFDELTKQVFDLKDVILGDIERGFDRTSDEDGDDAEFDHHKAVTKNWFARVSSSNKKHFILVLLKDVQSAWTLSLLLKSIWNCRPKDAVPSPFEAWSVYDEVPLDHNRSVMPLELLVEVMETERKWFRALEPYRQNQLLSELLKCAGGPIIRTVFHKAQTIFENYRDFQLQNIQECMTVVETQETKTLTVVDDKGKKTPAPARKHSATGDASQTRQPTPEAAQRELDAQIAQWNSIIKTLKDSQKLEEVELSFSDGTKQRMWKVNRPKPEVTETVDYIQLLPLSIAKQILDYVPRTQLNDCARVNKYWAYLVDEFKAELGARLKIDTEIKRLTELMQRHDVDNDNRDHSMHTFQTVTTGTISYVSRLYREPTACSGQTEPQRSQKSAVNSGFRQLLRAKKPKKRAQRLPPIRNLAELSERLNRRGAADDDLWDWCKKALELYQKPHDGKVTLPPVNEVNINGTSSSKRRSTHSDGVMTFTNVHFPCPLMSMSVDLPLKPALRKNFATVAPAKKRVKSADTYYTQMVNLTKNKPRKRYSLWSKDFSRLYTAFKIPYYKSPV